MSDDNVIRLRGAPGNQGECLDEEGENADRIRTALVTMLDSLKEQVESGQIRSIVAAAVYANGAPGQMMVVGYGGVLAQLGAMRVAESRLMTYAHNADEI
jgi:hypothetical protein